MSAGAVVRGVAGAVLFLLGWTLEVAAELAVRMADWCYTLEGRLNR